MLRGKPLEALPAFCASTASRRWCLRATRSRTPRSGTPRSERSPRLTGWQWRARAGTRCTIQLSCSASAGARCPSRTRCVVSRYRQASAALTAGALGSTCVPAVLTKCYQHVDSCDAGQMHYSFCEPSQQHSRLQGFEKLAAQAGPPPAPLPEAPAQLPRPSPAAIAADTGIPAVTTWKGYTGEPTTHFKAILDLMH